jgi:hypothetical protein
MYINTQYMRNSQIVYTVKMQSVSKSTIFGPKMDVEKWSRYFFEFPPYQKEVIFVTEFVILYVHILPFISFFSLWALGILAYLGIAPALLMITSIPSGLGLAKLVAAKRHKTIAKVR